MVETQQITAEPTVPKRVLVAEDSPVTQDLLKLILGQRGHLVDIAEDGEQALNALGKSPYDVALIDFRLPKLDGLEVARSYRENKNGDPRARLIAITADVEGLLAHKENCENFDQIIPKPLDVYEVCNVIERTGAAQEESAGEAGEPSGEDGPAGLREQGPALSDGAAQPRREKPSWAHGLEILTWPEDFSEARLPGSTVPAFGGLDSVDVILVSRPPANGEMTGLWERRPAHLFPIVDLTGKLAHQADFDASGRQSGDGASAQQLIHAFHQRRAQLHRDLVTTPDLGEKLLARLYVQDAPLTPCYMAEDRTLIRYNVPLSTDEVIREAEKQCRNGFLRRDFFDRFHVCYRCSSSRLHIREECAACRSPQLREDPYIHHFRCGTQSVESDFRDGDRLICPKCRRELSHFSVDYDKPGTALVCGRCGHAESEPVVGFLCLDCTTHFDGEVASTRDVFSYSLTQEGVAFMQMGQALRGPAQRTIRFSDLPLDFVVALNAAAKQYNDDQIPFAVVNLSYQNEREITREAGLRQFGQARDLFLENLKNALRDHGVVVKGYSYDFCLLNRTTRAEAEDVMADAIAGASQTLRFDLGVKAQYFGPADFA